jgi:Domain of unknown function (DUF4926)
MIERSNINAKETHFKASLLSQEAFMASINGNGQVSLDLYEQAFELEKQAALTLLDKIDIEPTRSVLFRSAAALAKKCYKYREAEKMIAHGLAGNPPDDVAIELRTLFDTIQKLSFPKKMPKKSKKKIVLLNNIPQSGLAAGDVGTVINIYGKGASFQVEFVNLNGAIVAVETLSAQQVRSVGEQDMIHSRYLNA